MKYTVLGLMSGSSLDGLDMALCTFEKLAGQWQFDIINAQTVKYPSSLAQQLRNASRSKALDLITLHKSYARFMADRINAYLRTTGEKPLLIASHGHTVFHYPEAGINFQIGDGAVISALTGLPVVCDFRSQDMALGGQGAPLVPWGDKLLFPGYAMLLNLGGFSNITVQDPFMAYDICPVNFALNYFARKSGLEYDKDGDMGRKGKIIPSLLQMLNSLEYYERPAPKSLSAHWFYENFMNIVGRFKEPVVDIMRTLYEHISFQIARELDRYGGKVLVTGGGAKNKFLIGLIREKTPVQIEIPGTMLIDYKEALIFAFLGLLRYLGETNVDKRITGADRNTSSGALYI